jgi:hypothetical protein
MELLSQAAAVLGLFSVVHERLVELIRSAKPKLPLWAGKIIDLLTVGALGPFSGVALALVTRANLLALFKGSAQHPAGTDAFFQDYMGTLDWAWFAVPEHIIGCVLMGFSTSFGSAIWHDFSKSLLGIRNATQSIPQDLRALAERLKSFNEPSAPTAAVAVVTPSSASAMVATAPVVPPAPNGIAAVTVASLPDTTQPEPRNGDEPI